jgi:hypothetical protein
MALSISLLMNYVQFGIILYFALAVRKGFKRKLDMDIDFNLEEMLANIFLYPLHVKRYVDIFLAVRSVKNSTGLNSSRYVSPVGPHYKMDFTTTIVDPPHIRAEKNRLGNIFDTNPVQKGNLYKQMSTGRTSSSRSKAGDIYGIAHKTTKVNIFNPEKIRLKYAA